MCVVNVSVIHSSGLQTGLGGGLGGLAGGGFGTTGLGIGQAKPVLGTGGGLGGLGIGTGTNTLGGTVHVTARPCMQTVSMSCSAGLGGGQLGLNSQTP